MEISSDTVVVMIVYSQTVKAASFDLRLLWMMGVVCFSQHFGKIFGKSPTGPIFMLPIAKLFQVKMPKVQVLDKT